MAGTRSTARSRRSRTRRARSPPTSSSARSRTWSGTTAAGASRARPSRAARSRSSARRPGWRRRCPTASSPAWRRHLPRPAELHVPVRHARLRGRDRPRDRPRRDRQLRRGRRLRQRHQPDDRRRAGARRRHPVDGAGAVRGDRLRRRRAAAHGVAGRVPDAVGGRPAVDQARPHRHARRRSTRSAPRASARPARSRPRRRSSTPPSTRCRRSASATSRCRCSRIASGRPSAPRTRGPARDPARSQLHEGRPRSTRRCQAIRDGAKPIAGGQSLVPMMRLRLASPDGLVDLVGPGRADRHPPGGRRARDRRHDPAPRVPNSADVQRGARAVAQAAAGIGSPAVRNRGTIGGSLAHADPHADLPAALLAVGGSVTVRSASGSRSIAAADLVVDYLTTSLADDELIVDVRLPDRRRPVRLRQVPPAGIDWSIVGAAVAVRGGKRHLRHHGPRLAAGPRDRLRGGRQRRRLARRGRRRGPARARRRSTTSTARPSTSGTWRACSPSAPWPKPAADDDGAARRRQRTVARQSCARARPRRRGAPRPGRGRCSARPDRWSGIRRAAPFTTQRHVPVSVCAGCVWKASTSAPRVSVTNTCAVAFFHRAGTLRRRRSGRRTAARGPAAAA